MELHGDTTFSVKQSKTAIPRELMITETGTQLFSFITKQIAEFVNKYHQNCLTDSEDQPRLSLGLTFSYPVYQSAINSGKLLRWTKGFNIPDVVGQDVCKLLQDEIDHQNLPVRVTALVNDAAGTIMSRAYTLPTSQARTSIGAIFGTGTNGVYLEKLSKIIKPIDGQYDTSTGEMFVSIEWGSFDDHLCVLPSTSYDVEINEASVNPGEQMFEKRVSGMFLGELLRTIALSMHSNSRINIFANHDSGINDIVRATSSLYTRWTVDSSILSVAEADDSEDLAVLRQKIVECFDIPAVAVSREDAQAIQVIAHAIGKRAARLAGMALGAVILQSEQLTNPLDPLAADTKTLRSDKISTSIRAQDLVNASSAVTSEATSDDLNQHRDSSAAAQEPHLVDVGVDGSVIELYPGFETYMREVLTVIEGIGAAGEKRIRIGIAKDGSSVGAAIIALLAAQ